MLGNADGPLDAVGNFATALAFLPRDDRVAGCGARIVGRLIDTPDDELLTVCFVGLAVLAAGVAEELGVSTRSARS